MYQWKISDFFEIEQGIGQGLLLSVLIFIISIEPLIIKLIHTKKLKKVDLDDWESTNKAEATH